MKTDKHDSRGIRALRQALKNWLTWGIIATGLTGPACAQGTIVFNNLANNDPSILAKTGGLVFQYDSSSWVLLNQDVNLLIGVNGQVIQTWLISDGSAKGMAVGGGHFADPSGGIYTLPGVTPGTDALIQIEAWAGNYDNPMDALAAGAGFSSVGFYNPTGGAGTPASLVNMPALALGFLPEPSSLVLLLVGAGALLVWNRRRV